MSLQMENALPDGFVFEKAQNIMRGAYQGTELFIVPLEAENQYQIQLYTNAEKSAGKEEFLNFLGTMNGRFPFVHHAGYNGSNLASVYVTSNGAEDRANLTAAVRELVSKCGEFGIHNCCAHCRGDMPVHAAAVDNAPLLLCDGCFSQVMGRAGSAGVRKENPLLGIIGAVFGVLIGSVLWIVIGHLGFIAGIAGLAIVFGGMKGYELLGGRLSKFGIAVCVLLSCLTIVGAEFASIGIAIYQELGKLYDITAGEAFRLIPELMKEPEMAGGVAKDLIVGFALAIWASYANIKSAWRQVGDGQTQRHTVVKF